MGFQQLGLTDVTCSQESFERLVKGGAIALFWQYDKRSHVGAPLQF
ncbi:MAG: hypothetical protein RIB93_04320 [Coleofasciculus sp. D1-CHI-01]